MSDETKTALLSKLRAPVADERAAFEAWATAIAEKYDVTRNGDNYMEPYTEWVWEAWQARAALASAPVADGEWPTLSDLHLQALMFAYNEGYSKAIDGRKFKNPFETSGSQAAAWELGTQDGTEARSKMESTPVAGYIKPDPAAPTHPRYVSELKYRSAADAEADPEGKGWLKVYAAPQASAEDVRNAALEEAAQALDRLHAENRRWHNEFREAAAAIRALKTQADKDGGQQRSWIGDWSAAIKSLPMGRADAEGIRSSSNACMYRNECRAMLDRLRAGDDFDIEAAAKTMAECMDYPWAHMPEKGREQMRLHAQSVIRAALSATQADTDKKEM
ncbi:hypothetical protein LWS69_02280 [Bordetella hinzii]|nr:hypothetical protein [Bordetella hinzii]